MNPVRYIRIKTNIEFSYLCDCNGKTKFTFNFIILETTTPLRHKYMVYFSDKHAKTNFCLFFSFSLRGSSLVRNSHPSIRHRNTSFSANPWIANFYYFFFFHIKNNNNTLLLGQANYTANNIKYTVFFSRKIILTRTTTLCSFSKNVNKIF